IESLRSIKQACPGALTSGGISNVSFSFRGNQKVREAMHSVFLYHGIKAGLDMGIVNAGMLTVYEEIEPVLLELIEDVVLNRNPQGTQRLLDYAATTSQEGAEQRVAIQKEWRKGSYTERIEH